MALENRNHPAQRTGARPWYKTASEKGGSCGFFPTRIGEALLAFIGLVGLMGSITIGFIGFEWPCCQISRKAPVDFMIDWLRERLTNPESHGPIMSLVRRNHVLKQELAARGSGRLWGERFFGFGKGGCCRCLPFRAAVSSSFALQERIRDLLQLGGSACPLKPWLCETCLQ